MVVDDFCDHHFYYVYSHFLNHSLGILIVIDSLVLVIVYQLVVNGIDGLIVFGYKYVCA